MPKNKTAWVRAASSDVRVPMESHPRRYITDTPVQVPLTPYYRRELAGGGLVETRKPKSTTPTQEG